jgi:diacylglycerol kinase (ATP)
MAEIFNTAIEKIMDFVSPELHPEIKLIKDLAAAGVLLAAFTALVTGAIVFIPKFF